MEMALVGQFGFWQILVIIVLVVLLFGRGKISQLMGDAAKGINAFKRGMKEGEDDEKGKAIDSAETIDVRADAKSRSNS